MPVVYIRIHEGIFAGYKKNVSERVHAAMVDVLGVHDDTWDQFFSEFEADPPRACEGSTADGPVHVPGGLASKRSVSGIPSNWR